MYQGQLFGQRGKMNSPIERRIASSGNDKSLAPEGFRIFYKVQYSLSFKLFQVFNFRFSRLETSESTCNHQCLAGNSCMVGSTYLETTIFFFCNGRNLFAQCEA